MSEITSRMWCADCGKQLQRAHGTAYIACCSGNRYWLGLISTPRDSWWPLKVYKFDGLHFALYEPRAGGEAP